MKGADPPVEIERPEKDLAQRLRAPRLEIDERLVRRLSAVCSLVEQDPAALASAGRDWWPITIGWATRGEVPSLPGVVVRPASRHEVSAVLALCNEARVPVTPMAGRSGVCGGSVPVFGGVALDLRELSGIEDVDTVSLQARVLAGTFGPDVESGLRASETTLGHWPQSMDISTLGGWIACRGAGQYSTRFGKIEDMVVGLEVALADGRTIRTGGAGPRAALGPDLNQVFVGSEGTLGVVISGLLRVHPLPGAQGRMAFGFRSFIEGLEACRAVLRRGATPAVLRLYDEVESARNFGLADICVLVVLDEADETILAANLEVVRNECTRANADELDSVLVQTWLDHRNDVSALGPLYRAGIVVDTVEIAGRWSILDAIYSESVSALGAIEGTLAASAHESHAYTDGACLYFTFAGRPVDESIDEESRDRWSQEYYLRAWETVMEVVLRHGGAISHHHGVGINRARFMRRALGDAADVLESLKQALDPRGILNPGKLGLSSPFGEVLWP